LKCECKYNYPEFKDYLLELNFVEEWGGEEGRAASGMGSCGKE